MKKPFILLLLLSVLSMQAFAAKRYWIATTSTNWNNSSNWSTTATGTVTVTPPGSSDTAYFTSSRNGSCSIDVAVNVARFEVQSGYTGTISQNAFKVTIGNGNGSFSGGTFTGGSKTISATGSLTISGTAFTSTSDTLFASGGISISSGSFTHNSGTVCFNASQTWTVSNTGGTTFNKVSFKPTSSMTVTVTSTTSITVSGQLSIDGSAATTLNSGTINVTGNVVATNTSSGGGGSALINISGAAATQSLTGNSSAGTGVFPKITINKSSGTLTLSNTISAGNDWTWTAGTISPGTSTVVFVNALAVTGNQTLNNVTFQSNSTTAFTITRGTTLTVNGTLTIDGSGAITLNTGAIAAKGNLSVLNTNTSSTGGTATITMTGTGTRQIITGSATTNAGILPNLSFTASAATTDSILAGKEINVKGNVSISGSFGIIFRTGTLRIYGNLTSSNMASTGGGDATFILKGTANTTFNGPAVAGQGRFPAVTISKDISTATVTFSSGISLANNFQFIDGTVIPGTSGVAFYGGAINADGQGTSTTMSFYSLAIGSGTVTLTGNLDVDNNLTIASGMTLSAGSNQVSIGGNMTNNGTWTAGSSSVTFDGTGYKQIGGTSTLVFYDLGFNKTANSLTIAKPVKVNHVMTLTKGHIKTSSSNYIEIVDDATVSGGGIGAYVAGPFLKTGNDAFTFPLGDTTLTDSTAYHPIAITAPSSISDQYLANYKASGQILGSSLTGTLASLSACEYWTLQRLSGTGTVTVTLKWNSNCDNSAFSEMRVSSWNGTQWTDLGQGSYSIAYPSGSVAASSSSTIGTSAVNFTFGYASVSKSFATLTKTLDGGYYNTDGYVLYFGFDEEYKDNNGKLSFNVTRLSSDRTVSLIANPANNPADNYGNNRYKIDLFDNSNAPLAAGYYILEVTNDKNEKWYLRFKI